MKARRSIAMGPWQRLLTDLLDGVAVILVVSGLIGIAAVAGWYGMLLMGGLWLLLHD